MNPTTKIYKTKTGVNMATTEGVTAVNEAINFLKNVKPTYALGWNLDLWKSCQDHVLDQGPKGTTGHTGSDGSTAFVRMARYGNLISPSGENLAYGAIDAKDSIIQLIIDDGVANRGHRTNIFASGYVEYGSYFGDHTTYRTELCQNFAVGTYSLAEPTFATLMSTFNSQAVTWTSADGAPASYTSYSGSSTVAY